MKLILFGLVFGIIGCGATQNTYVHYKADGREITLSRNSSNENDKRKFHYEETRLDGTKIKIWGGAETDPNVEAINAQNDGIVKVLDKVATILDKLIAAVPVPMKENKGNK